MLPQKEKLINNSYIGFFYALFNIICWGYVIYTLNRGVSVDEGYYLQGYVQHTKQFGVLDFHNIIRTLFSFLDFNNTLQLRWFYFALSNAVFAFFTLALYRFLRNRKYDIKESIFFPLIVFTWILSFCFASPVLYYDTLQLLIYLVVFSLMFISDNLRKYRAIIYFMVGFLLVYSITNYLPSGILLFLTVFLWIIVNCKIEIRKVLLSVLIGVLISSFIYHFYIHSLSDFYQNVYSSFFYAQNGDTKHDIGGLLTKAMIFFVEILLLCTVIVGIYSFVNKSRKKNDNLSIFYILYFTVSVLLIGLSFVSRLKLGSLLIFIPIAILLADIKLTSLKELQGKELFLIILCLLVPVFGVFGTNQAIQQKTFYFLIFWFILFYLLYSKFLNKISKVNRIFLPLLFFIEVGILFLHNGYFKRIHNYYGFKSSNVYVENTPRLNNIKISSHQKMYIENINRELKASGFHSGDTILGFEVDFIPIYAVGGTVMPSDLFYAHYNMTQNVSNIPKEKVKYILLYKRAEKEFTEFLKSSDWDFPNSYKRISIGKMAENMTDGQSSFLYVSEK